MNHSLFSDLQLQLAILNNQTFPDISSLAWAGGNCTNDGATNAESAIAYYHISFVVIGN